ncbi:hypothetical protein FB451DRAFT_1491652 [Mycena latifolia]|nr:hypothetical protein FB451DRAFT_1491652 [Mycena latifolia]
MHKARERRSSWDVGCIEARMTDETEMTRASVGCRTHKWSWLTENGVGSTPIGMNSRSRRLAPTGEAFPRGRRGGGWRSARTERERRVNKGRHAGTRRMQARWEAAAPDGATISGARGCTRDTMPENGAPRGMRALLHVRWRITLRTAADVRAAPSEQVEVEGSGVRQRASDIRGVRRAGVWRRARDRRERKKGATDEIVADSGGKTKRQNKNLAHYAP